MASTTPEHQVVRYHTAGRRQPQLIGKDPSGVPLSGGPYTLYQVGGLAVIPILWQTRALWAGDLTGIAVVAVIAMTTAAVIWLLGRIDFSGRNVIYAGIALLTAWLKTLRTGPRPTPRDRAEIRITGEAVCARPTAEAPTALTGSSAVDEPTDDTTSEPVDPALDDDTALSVQHPPVQVSAAGYPPPSPAPGVAGRLSPLESFLAAADKIKAGNRDAA